MLIIIGKTCSGKTEVVSELEKIGFKRFVSYTTRKRRRGEKKDVDYHFLTDDEFENRVSDGMIDMGIRTYTMADGKQVRYGYSSSDALLNDVDGVIILTPDAVSEAIARFGNNCKCCYLYSNESIIAERLKKRGDSKDS